MPKNKDPKTPSSSKSHVPAGKPGVPKEAAAALAKVEAEMAALSPRDLTRISVDIPRAVAVAVGAVPHLAALRGRIVEELPKLPIHLVDELGTYALAVWYAHLLALPTVTEHEVTALLEEATPLREDMLVAAEALAHKGYLDRASVKAIREGQGNIDKANDLVALSALFTAAWSTVESRTTVEWADVERAAQLGPQILVALGARDQPGVKQPDAADPAERRTRAYTLFVRAYEECRRAVHYLRWHEDDAADIVPSLHATRGRRAASAAAPAEGQASPVEASSPAEP